MSPVHVAVAVIVNNCGQILLTKRPDHVHQGGLWEFPGGKLEPGETLSEALHREIFEELGIEVLDHYPLIRLVHHYSDKSVLLDVHRVISFKGVPQGCEGQPLAWIGLDDFDQYPMPAADKPIINAIRLPAEYVITGKNPENSADFLQKLENGLKQGFRLVQLRAKTLSDSEYLELAQRAVDICNQYGGQLMLNAAPELVQKTDAHGVHLTSHRLMSLTERPFPSDRWVAASCHNEQELLHAQRLELDFVVLSPINPTGSHAGATPLGWQRFEAMVRESSIPVYALGGVGPMHLDQARAAGAQGIAGISDFWSE